MRIYSSYILAVIAFGCAAKAQVSCYYPDGRLGSGLVACRSATNVTSHCCRESDICLSNGMCFSPGLGSLVRRGCTDKSWQSPDCPNVCTNDTFHTTDAVLTPCGPYNNFCCGQDEAARNCCSNGNTTLIAKLAGGDIMPSLNHSVSATASSSPTSSASGAPASCPASKKTTLNAVIGIGAGFGVLMFVLAGIAISSWKGMKKQERENLTLTNEKQSLVNQKQTLQENYDWLYQESPGPLRREMDAKKRARVGTTEVSPIQPVS